MAATLAEPVMFRVAAAVESAAVAAAATKGVK
jgi:hypothetical protein